MKKYILTIDAGTTGLTVILFDDELKIVDKEYSELRQIYPNENWVEHDPTELIDKIELATDKITKKHFKKNITSIGITNQRESVVVWNKKTGKPIYNTIVWQCKRTNDFCKSLKKEKKSVFKKTGLYIDSYFSATKLKWIIDNVKCAKLLIENDKLMFGTVDTWIIWNLTNRKKHLTDFTNASRTLLYNINDKKWDNELLKLFNIPKKVLPEVKNSIDNYGIYQKYNIPINAVAGDQQAALFGQGCFKKGNSKCTYGTGLFFLMNTGQNRIDSKNMLITTLSVDENGKPNYAIEGSVFIGGAIVQWLRDELKLISKASETDKISESLNDSNGVYIVPAFVGLGAPYWKPDTKGLITGLTRNSNYKHIIRAALESIAFQAQDLFSAISKDFKQNIKELYVDGGATNNNFLMQFQSNISNVTIFKPNNIESTSVGVCIMSGLKSKVWPNAKAAIKNKKIEKIYKSKISNENRRQQLENWKLAVEKI